MLSRNSAPSQSDMTPTADVLLIYFRQKSRESEMLSKTPSPNYWWKLPWKGLELFSNITECEMHHIILAYLTKLLPHRFNSYLRPEGSYQHSPCVYHGDGKCIVGSSATTSITEGIDHFTSAIETQSWFKSNSKLIALYRIFHSYQRKLIKLLQTTSKLIWRNLT